MTQLPLDQKIQALRRFARFFAQRLGPLEAGPAGSSYSATEVRVLDELSAYEQRTVSTLSRSLGLDAGYLSRVLRRLETTGVVARLASTTDSRQQPFALTEAGRAEVTTLDAITTSRYGAMVRTLPAHIHGPLLDAMERIESALAIDVPARDATPWLLRPHRPGDLSYVAQRMVASMLEEFELGAAFEASVLTSVATVATGLDQEAECVWIAERDGVAIGSVFLRRVNDVMAELSMLHVESQARGIGIGRRLIAEALAFALRAGYGTVRLELLDVQKTARALVHAAGFRHSGSSTDVANGRTLERQVWVYAPGTAARTA